MNVFDNFLKQVYGNSQSLLYFYITLAFFALFLIIIILIILFSAENRSARKKTKEINNKENVEKTLSKTIDFKDILEPKKEEIEEKVEGNIIESKEEIKEEEKDKDIFEINNEVTNEINIDNVVYEDEDIILEKEKPLNNEKEKVEVKELDYNIEIPKVKPMDIDDYLFRREQEVKEEIIPEIVQNEETETKEEIILQENIKEEVKVELSDDEVKNRLAKLKAKKEAAKNDEIPDKDLDDLMKAVGLDNEVIPEINNEEKQILGR